MINDARNTIKGVFLLILAIAGNFVVETLGCRTRKLLTNNMVAKHLVSAFILYFSIGLFNKKDKNPTETVKKTMGIYLMFLLFTRMNLTFTIIVFVLFGGLIILTQGSAVAPFIYTIF